MDFIEFRKEVLKVKGPRAHVIKGSLGLAQAYPFYRHKYQEQPSYRLTYNQYSNIVKMMNQMLADDLVSGEDVILPHRMGRLELRKKNSGVTITPKGLKVTYPVDWDQTLKLWHSDEEAKEQKIVVRDEQKEVFRIYYNRNIACYTNKTFYQFSTTRALKVKLKEEIQKGNTDAFTLK